MVFWLTFLVPLTLVGWYSHWQWQNLAWFQRAIKHHQRPESDPTTTVDVLIPVRNEAAGIGDLLTDLTRQSTLRTRDQIWVIDDFSTDATPSIVQEQSHPVIRYLHLRDFPAAAHTVAHKKAALTFGVQSSAAPLVVTTDGDCRWPPEVLAWIKSAFAEGSNFISGPVLIHQPHNACSGFQALDMLAYMLLTAAYHERGRPILANGAHLSFSRQLFGKIQGYAGVDHLSSGDDVLLLQKAIDSGLAKTSFLLHPDAVVTTNAVVGWRALWNQRLRWAGKTKAYTNPELTRIQALVFALSFSTLIGVMLGFLRPTLAIGALLAWGVKAYVDAVLLRAASRFFGRESWMKFYPFSQLIQPLYLVAIGLGTLLGVPTQWKDRS